MGNLLSAISGAPILSEGYYIDPGALGNFAKAIIESVGIIGVGIICFALVLKAITLPFDIYQRVKMRKQTLIMRKMQPDLEKLQKQYAGDKQMYNQKMMELYKKNGYSMLGACLPMIISMVILIIAFTGFRGYSTSANLAMYEKMSHAYNQSLAQYVVDGKDYHLPIEGEEPDELTFTFEEDASFSKDGVKYTAKTISEISYLVVESEENVKCIFYQYPLFENGTVGKREYLIDTEKVSAEAEESINAMINDEEAPVAEEEAYRLYFAKIGAAAAKDWYDGKGDYAGQHNNAGFLWIKNVWYPDVSYDHPIQNYKSFSSQFSTVKFQGDKTKYKLESVMGEKEYGYLTMDMTSYTKTPNGYFILIILSIGLMVASQLISMKSQKETNKYQTVDGSGAKTQKIMLFVMPIIYGVFAFMYSAAFSVYMVMSSAITIITTLVTNLIIGHIYHKKEVEEIKEQNSRIPAWMKARKEKEKQNKKNGK